MKKFRFVCNSRIRQMSPCLMPRVTRIYQPDVTKLRKNPVQGRRRSERRDAANKRRACSLTGGGSLYRRRCRQVELLKLLLIKGSVYRSGNYIPPSPSSSPKMTPPPPPLYLYNLLFYFQLNLHLSSFLLFFQINFLKSFSRIPCQIFFSRR
jgi:hypothetical protein